MTHFIKMHGLGNDFVIFDSRKSQLPTFNSQLVESLGDRHKGIGFDQMVIIHASNNATAYMQIYNSDGSEVSACGNATRCVADILIKESGDKEVTIETKAGILKCQSAGKDLVTVNMGQPKTAWQDIPLASEVDTLSIPISEGPLANPVGVSVGNPHAVFFTKNISLLNLSEIGPKLEHNPLFPERANIEAAEVISRNEIALRVWERGAGETMACGTGACATAVAAVRRGLTDRKVQIHLSGGDLLIEWLENNEILMTGPVSTSFEGEVTL